MCFSGSGPTHFFRRWVRIGIGPTHFLRWIVYYCVCIQHDIDKSQISFIELCETLRTNSGLRAINSCLHLFWPQLCNRNICNKHCFVTAELKFSFHQQTGVWTHPHFYTDLCPCSHHAICRLCLAQSALQSTFSNLVSTRGSTAVSCITQFECVKHWGARKFPEIQFWGLSKN